MLNRVQHDMDNYCHPEFISGPRVKTTVILNLFQNLVSIYVILNLFQNLVDLSFTLFSRDAEPSSA